ARRVGTVQHRALGLGSSLRLDVGRRRAVGLGAVSLWPLGLHRWLVGVGAGPDRGAARVRSCARCLLRRTRGGRCRQRAAAQLGRARLGRAGRAVVGLVSLRRAAVVGRLGRAACRQQRRRQSHDRRRRQDRHRLQERRRAERGGGGPRGSLRPATRARGARRGGRYAAAAARARSGSYAARCRELRHRQRPRGAAARGCPRSSSRGHAAAGSYHRRFAAQRGRGTCTGHRTGRATRAGAADRRGTDARARGLGPSAPALRGEPHGTSTTSVAARTCGPRTGTSERCGRNAFAARRAGKPTGSAPGRGDAPRGAGGPRSTPSRSGARSARAITYHRGAAGGGRLRDGAGAASRRGRGRMINALAVEGLPHSSGGLQALSDVSLHAAAGERLVVVGHNGAGKTTLFNIVTGLISPHRGRITLFDRDVTRLQPFRRARLGLGRTFQITTLFPKLTVLDNVLLAVQGADGARFTLHRPATAYPHLVRAAEQLLDEWSLGDRRDVPTRHLSYGEQRQLELILALAARPRVLLLDEPTAGLSPAETAAVAAMVQRFPRDVTLLLLDHDMAVALPAAEP